MREVYRSTRMREVYTERSDLGAVHLMEQIWVLFISQDLFTRQNMLGNFQGVQIRVQFI